MLHKGMSKSQIEKELEQKGDFVQIDYLTKFLRETLSIDMKKFVCLKLAKIYERRSMFDNAAKMFDSAALVSIAISEKIKHYIKEAELYIKAGHFEEVGETMKKAMNEANASQKAEILFTIKYFYRKQAEVYEREGRRNNASIIYEKLLQMNLSKQEDQEIREKLLYLYEKLGRFKDIEMLRRELE